MKCRLLVCFLAIFLLACATGSVILTGTKREPIPSAEVKLYSSPPRSYEVIGIVKASSDAGMTEQECMNYAIEEIKKQAASIGANGILIKASGETGGTAYGTFIPMYGGGGYYAGGVAAAQTIMGDAIYVSGQ